MSNDARDIEWRCGCGASNPDYNEGCPHCGEPRYPDEEGEDDSLSNLYDDESHRMQIARDLKR